MTRPSKPSVCIISLTPVTDEPRVLRQSEALARHGWSVAVCGYRGRQPPPDYWRFIEVKHQYPDLAAISRKLLFLQLAASRWSADSAERYYWQHAGYEAIYQQIAFVENVRCDLVIGHDYYTAPIASRLAKLSGVPYSVDCHEYAYEQYMHDKEWVRYQRPWVHALQKRFLSGAGLVTTVCDGIAAALKKDYDLRVDPVVVRSVAQYARMPFRETGVPVTVLYHGIVSPMRGLEAAIASVPYWRPEFRLVIRGNGPDDYVVSLRNHAVRHGVANRVELADPVPFRELVPQANLADIGYFVQENISLQKRYTLPNKFFEYIMAGVALCVSDLPEMARVVKKFGIGRLVSAAEPREIAAVINSFSRGEIDEYKRKNLAAARVLCWEKESPIMLDAYDRLLHARAAVSRVFSTVTQEEQPG